MRVSGRLYFILLFIVIFQGCKTQPVKELTEPSVDHSSNYISTPPSQTHLINLLVRGDYLTLELELDSYHQAYLENPMNDQALDWAYSSFGVSNLEVLKYLDSWVEHAPGGYHPYLARAIYYTHMGGLSRGTALARDTTKEQFFQMEKYFDNALADFDKVEEFNQFLLPAYCSKSYILRASRRGKAQGNRKRNLVDYADGMLNAHPDSSVIRHCFMTSLLPRWHGSYSEMISLAKKSKSRWVNNPKLKSLYFRVPIDKAEGDVSIGRFSQALVRLDKALEYGDDAGVLAAKGDVYIRMRDAEKAIKFYELSLKQDLYNESVYSDLSLLVYQLAVGAIEDGEFDYARTTLDSVLAINDSNHTALVLYGQSYMLEGKYDDSLKYLQRAVVVAPHVQSAWEYLLTILMQMGDISGFKKSCAEASTIFTDFECPSIDIRS